MIKRFANYVCKKLRAEIFEPRFDDPEAQIFAASVDSFRALSAFALGAQNAKGEPLSFDCGYVEFMTPNAFADRHDGAHVIGMHQALLVTIMDLALYVFTQADLFPDIGDASVETSPLLPHAETPGLYLLRLTLAGGKIETARDKARVPVDADRHIAAVYMAMLMARFVWMHELFHCVGGHVAYLAHHGHEAGLDELPQGLGLVGFKPEQSIVTPEIKQSFEFEADAQALKACCEIQIAGHENMGGIAAMGFKTRFETTIMGAYLMTWLFDEYERFAQSQNGSTHPLPQERLQHLIKSVHSTYALEIDGFDIFHQAIVDQFNRLMTRLGANISVEIAQCLNLPCPMNTNEMVRSFAYQISL